MNLLINDKMGDNAMIKYKITIEMNYLVDLLTILYSQKLIFDVSSEEIDILENFVAKYKFKHNINIDHTTNSIKDVITNILEKNNFSKSIRKYIHFGLSNEDINSVAFMLGYRFVIQDGIQKSLEKLVYESIIPLIKHCKSIPIITKTNISLPSLLGKELAVYRDRLDKCRHTIDFTTKCLSCKFGGSIGNFNAHSFVFPEIDWHEFSDKFVNEYKFYRTKITRSTDDFDSLTDSLNVIKHMMNVLNDTINYIWLLCRDEYLIENNKKYTTEKIDTVKENYIIACALITGIAESLQESSNLTKLHDSSTLLKSIPLALHYVILCLDDTYDIISILMPNKQKILKDVTFSHKYILEGMLAYLTHIDRIDIYESTKAFFYKYDTLSLHEIQNWINNLPLEKIHKEKLKTIRAENYIGQFIEMF
jgi:adenylosuccinate lyase